MRRRLSQAILLAAAFALALQSGFAQQSDSAEIPESQNACSAPPSSDEDVFGPTIAIAEVQFDGDLRLPVADQQQIASSLRQLSYPLGLDRATDELVERVREAWQDHGYVQVEVSGENRILSSSPVSESIAVTVRVNAGEQYRLGEIAFKNNKAITGVKKLRDLFPISDGEISDRSKIAKGLENLRKEYGELGYINFTVIPTPRFNEDNQTVSFDMDIDEGKQFVVSSISFLGLDQRVSDDLSKEL
jgi:outer membrane protein insertion porin family